MSYTLKHRLQRMAQRLLYDKTKAPLDQHRVVWCMRKLPGENVRFYRQVTGARARMTGTMLCGMPWTCPLCAAKIGEERRRELQAAAVHWTAERGNIYLLTLTFPHTSEDDLADLLARQAKAVQRFRNSRTYKGMRLRYGIVGSVVSSEVTVGRNGWHPHQHQLIFGLPGIEQDRALIRGLKREWMRCCLKAGLLVPDGTLKPFRDFWRHALDLRGGQYAAEYIAKFGRDEKWGMTRELTSAHAKVGVRRTMRSEDMHFTPFQLLEWAHNGDYGAAELFREYAEAFKGKRMLTWSRKLKVRLGVVDLSDEELAAAPLPEETLVGWIPAESYQVVLTRNAVGELLDYVAECCVDPEHSQLDLDDFVAQLKLRPPGHKGDLLVKTHGVGRSASPWRHWNAA